MLTETSVRVIGVCFGHQIVGRALKAEVGRNPQGWEAAVNDVELSPRGKEIFGVDKIVCCLVSDVVPLPSLLFKKSHGKASFGLADWWR